MADRLTTIIDIQTAESVKATAALADAEARLKKESGEVAKRLAEEAKAHDQVVNHVRASAKATQDATTKLDQMIRREQLAAKIAKEHGTSVQTARRAVGAFGKDLDRAAAEAAQYARRLDVAQRETQELARAQRAAASTGRGLLSTVNDLRTGMFLLAGGLGIAAVKDQAREALGALMQMEAAQRTLNKATGGEGAAAMSFVRMEADRLGLSLGSTAGEFGKLSAAALGTKLQGEGVRDIFSAVSEVGATLALSAQDQEGALKALGQMMSKGTVQAEELRGQLGERIPGAFQIMARGLGVTTQELGKMLETGQVLAEDALPKFAAELRKTFGTDAEQRIESTAATLARFETTVFELRSKTAELALGPGGLKEWADLMNALLARLAGTSAAVEKQTQKVGALSEALRSFAALVWVAIQAQQALNKAQEVFGQQQVEFKTWNDKIREAMEAGLVVQKRWTAEVEEATSWEDKMAAAVKKASDAIDAQEAAAQKNAAALAAMADAARARLAAASAAAAATSKRYQDEELAFLDDGLRTREEILGAEKKLAAERKKSAAARKADEKAAAAAAEKSEEERLEALRAQDELWNQIAETAFAIADSIGGKWGDMLGNLVSGVLGIRDAWKQVQGAQGTGQQLMAGFGLGQQAGGLLSGLGVRSGPGQAGGALSGLFGAGGAAIAPMFGLPPEVGALIGGVFGELVGGLKIFQEGGHTAVASFELYAGRLRGVTEKVEGDLSDGIDSAQSAIAKSINGLLASLGGFVGEGGLADLSFKIRQEKDKTEYWVREAGKTYQKFGDEQAAVVFFIQELLRKSDIQGLTKNVEAALGGSTATSFEQLAADLERARAVDLALMTDQERHLAMHTQAIREEINAYQDLGVSMGDVIEMMLRAEDAAARQAEMTALGVAGVDTSLAAGMRTLEQLHIQAAAEGDLNATYAAIAETLGRVEVGTAEWGQGLDDLGDRFPDLKDKIRDLADRMEQTGESVEVAARAIDGIDVALLEKASAAFEAAQIGNLLRQVAEFTGDAELLAQAVQFENMARRLQIELMIAQAKAYNILTPAMEEAIRAAMAAAEAAGAPVGTPARTGGSGGGSSRKQKQEELQRATEAWNTELDRLAALQAGATEDELSRAAALAELAAKGRDAKMSTEQIAGALSMLAELQLRDLAGPWAESAATLGRIDLKNAFVELRDRAKADFAAALVSAVDNPQAYRAARDAIEAGLTAELHKLGQDALTGLGSPLRALRLQFQENARAIRFMLSHLEDLGLTLGQVANQVRQSVLPSLLDMIEAQAVRVGDEKAVGEIQQQRAEMEQVLQRVQFENAVKLLEIAGALTPSLQSLVDRGRELFDAATAIGAAVATISSDPFVGPFIKNNQQWNAPPPGSTGGGDTEESLADIIARLQRDAMTPMERLAADFEEMMARIATSSGTAEERALAAALAQEAYARALAEMENLESIADIIADLERDAMTPVERLAADFEAMMARIAASSGTAEEKALAAALAQEAYAKALAELKEAGGGGAAGATADILRRLRRNAASDLERLEMDFADLFQEIADSSGTAAEKAEALALAEEELARLRQELTDRQLTDLYSLAAKLEQEILSRAAPKAQIESAQAAFQAAAANLDINDEDSVKAFREAADAYLNSAASYSDLVGSDQILKTAQEAVLAILTHYGITGSGPAVNPPPLVLGPPPGAVAPLAGFGGAAPLAPPAPIIVASPAGAASSMAGIETRLASIETILGNTRADGNRHWQEGARSRNAIVLAASQIGR